MVCILLTLYKYVLLVVSTVVWLVMYPKYNKKQQVDAGGLVDAGCAGTIIDGILLEVRTTMYITLCMLAP